MNSVRHPVPPNSFVCFIFLVFYFFWKWLWSLTPPPLPSPGNCMVEFHTLSFSPPAPCSFPKYPSCLWWVFKALSLVGTLLLIIYLFILTAHTESTLAVLSYLDISSSFSSPGVFPVRPHIFRKLSLSWAALPWAPSWVSVGSTSQDLGAKMCLLRFPKIIALSRHLLSAYLQYLWGP